MPAIAWGSPQIPSLQEALDVPVCPTWLWNGPKCPAQHIARESPARVRPRPARARARARAYVTLF